jgi:hypothetical protein
MEVNYTMYEILGRNKVVAELQNEFPVLNICDVHDWIKVTLGIDLFELDWEDESKEIVKFCENFQVYLYEVPGEDFNEYDGIQKAQALGYKGVVLSSLS